MNRLTKIFEAIDSEDTDLYWLNRKAWLKKHGYTGKNYYDKGKMIYVPVRREFRNGY